MPKVPKKELAKIFYRFHITIHWFVANDLRTTLSTPDASGGVDD